MPECKHTWNAAECCYEDLCFTTGAEGAYVQRCAGLPELVAMSISVNADALCFLIGTTLRAKQTCATQRAK